MGHMSRRISPLNQDHTGKGRERGKAPQDTLEPTTEFQVGIEQIQRMENMRRPSLHGPTGPCLENSES